MSEQIKPYFIGVSGGSASGKTFFLQHLINKYPKEKLTLISQDNYYKPHEEQKRDANGEINFDHPDSVNLDSLVKDLQRLTKGETIVLKEYTFGNGNKEAKEIAYAPAPIMLIEGLFVFYKKEIAEQLDLKIFVEADEHIKLSRRIKRDYEERGYGLTEVLKMYENHVIPMYKQYVAPYKEQCDLIIPNNLHMERAMRVICDHVDRVLGG